MFRELHEEVGLVEADVELLGVTSDWLRYKLPDKFIRRHSKPLCIGQKQRWFMLRLTSDEGAVRFDRCHCMNLGLPCFPMACRSDHVGGPGAGALSLTKILPQKTGNRNSAVSS